MSESQYSSPSATRVNAGKAHASLAGDLANGSIEQGQDGYDPAEVYPDQADDWYTPMDRKNAN